MIGFAISAIIAMIFGTVVWVGIITGQIGIDEMTISFAVMTIAIAMAWAFRTNGSNKSKLSSVEPEFHRENSDDSDGGMGIPSPGNFIEYDLCKDDPFNHRGPH